MSVTHIPEHTRYDAHLQPVFRHTAARSHRRIWPFVAAAVVLIAVGAFFAL